MLAFFEGSAQACLGGNGAQFLPVDEACVNPERWDLSYFANSATLAL